MFEKNSTNLDDAITSDFDIVNNQSTRQNQVIY